MAVLIWSGSLFCQQTDDVLEESVRVVNVEVPVRVYFQGKPVDNLTRNDFTLYEGGKHQDIHGFILQRKRIKVQELALNAERVETPKSRHFTLVFRITDYTDYLKKGIDHVFAHVLGESDRLLVFVNDRHAFFSSLEDRASVKGSVDTLLREASTEARNKLLLYLKSIESLVDRHKFDKRNMSTKLVTEHWVLHDYLRDFLRVWKEYKEKYLVPDINKYYNFARFLKNTRGEKWVINFYQFELFPNIVISSESMRYIRRKIGELQANENQEAVSASRILSRLLAEIEQELSVAKDFPADEVAKIFHNVDATFHSIFMKTSRSVLSEDIEYLQVASDLENSLRSITDLTGGELVVSNRLDQALDRIGEVEDVYYILTYAPKNPDQVGKIRVKLKNRKLKLVYSPNLRSGYLSQFLEDREIRGQAPRIEEMKFEDGRLMFGVTDFFWHEPEGGRLSIRIRVQDSLGRSVFDQKKSINANQKKINIALNFAGMKDGEYDFVVDVADLASSLTGTRLLKARIAHTP